MEEKNQRRAVIAEARSWLGTPFHHGARIKDVGVDCQTFIGEVYAAVGLFDARAIPYVPAQWFLNGREELYVNYLSRYASEYAGSAGAPPAPQPGDIVVVKTRWVHSHGAIVIAWPQVIHCHPPGVRLSDIRTNPVFAGRQLKFFDPWKKAFTAEDAEVRRGRQ